MDNTPRENWLAEAQAAYQADGLVEPPEWVRDRARRVFGARQADRSGTTSGPPLCVRAALVFDSRRPGLATAGVRSSGVIDGPWQLLFRGGDVDVDMWVRPNQDGRTLNVRGQALSLAGGFISAGVVEAQPSAVAPPLNGAALPTVRSELEPSGEFALANLQRGRYDVWLQFGAQRIESSDVEF